VNHTKDVQLVGGAVVTNSATSRGGVSARSYDDGAFGFASFPSLSDDAIPGALQAAAENAALLGRRRRLGKGDLPEGTAGQGLYDYRSHKPPLTDAEQLEAVRAVDAWLRERYPDLANIDVNLAFLAMEKGLATSTGVLTYSYIPRTILSVRLSYQADDGVIDLHDTFGGFGDPQEHLTDVTQFHEGLDTLYSRLREKAAGVYCKPGEHDVILDSKLAGILAHEAIGHTCEADLVLAGSVAGDHVGDVVASEMVTLVDYAERGTRRQRRHRHPRRRRGRGMPRRHDHRERQAQDLSPQQGDRPGDGHGTHRQRPRLRLLRRAARQNAQHHDRAGCRQPGGHDRRRGPRLLPDPAHERPSRPDQRVHVRGQHGLRDRERADHPRGA
jgi:hypothetical protein